MNELEQPSVLIVDDEPDERFPFAQSLSDGLNVEVVHPQDVTPRHIAEAELVLVDYVLENWSERDELGVMALRPVNGVALTSVLRAHAEADGAHQNPAFALLSAHLDTLSPDFPPEPRPHILAQRLNLEWVFPKGRLSRTIPQIKALAQAARELPRNWQHRDYSDTISQLHSLLNIKEGMPGTSLALEDVERSHPPVHESSVTSRGLSILRWFLHRILPYPTFLLDSQYLASRLRIEPAALRRLLASDSGLRTILETVEYSGILSGFLGLRWWRSGLEAWIWEVTDGRPHRPEYIHKALTDLGLRDLEPVSGDCEIVCISGTDYQPLPKLYRMDEAVRVQPDYWPSYADQAWTSIEAARDDPGLRALVLHDDVERLS